MSSSDDEFKNDKIAFDESSQESENDQVYQENEGISWNKDFYKSSSDEEDSENEELELEEAMRLQKQQQAIDDEYYFEEEFEVVKKEKVVPKKEFKSDGSLLDMIIQMNLEFMNAYPEHSKMVEERIAELEKTRGYLTTAAQVEDEQLNSDQESVVEELEQDEESFGDEQELTMEMNDSESETKEQTEQGLVFDEYVPIDSKPVKLKPYKEKKRKNPFSAKSHIKGIKAQQSDDEELNENETLNFEMDENDFEFDQQEVDEKDDSDLEYYNNVVQKKAKVKETREAEHQALQKEERESVINPYIEDRLDGENDPKRLATWKILNNRGLTPRRKKENRNPRVKRKLKYESAMKKLSSVRRVAVDKSKLGKYGGEKTGIKVNLSRSVRF